MFDSHAPTQMVLIVDDEYVPRSLQSMALEGTGRYRTVETGNAADALGALSEQHFDCAVVDYAMPDMTGPELVKSIRHTRGQRGLKIVMLLPEQGGIGVDSNVAGVEKLLMKPVNPWELASAVDSLTGAPNNSASVLSIESLLRAFPYPAMVLDSNHRVILANGTFYEQTGTGIGSCYVHCMEEMHEDGQTPHHCPLEECLRTLKPAEQLVQTVMGDMRVTVYPLPTRAGGSDQLFLHVTAAVA